MLKKLLNILNEHKGLNITGGVLFIIPMFLRIVLPHLSFLMTFLSFSGVCCVIYGLLLHFEKSDRRALSVTSKIMRYTALGLIAVFLITQVFIQSKIIAGSKTTDTECEYILVLGCGLRGKNLTRTGISRAEAAIEYLNKYPDCRAILCGGIGEDEEITESLALYNYMEKRGIDASRMICENRSTDTTENIGFAKEILESEGVPLEQANIAVVTNDFHLYRSTLIMNKAGIPNAYPISAPTPNVPFLHLSQYLREYFSVILEYLGI